ncbi:hypothetical protein J2X20_005326 [Pelomonas saccharophila]|uniref:Uncharacterized protein n=1 Tax=Roseateles saccharophilus TaxID=304 RepID=A0ABU1YUV4_ROSSA|nr:hypothetical protein [Roseateles saccharophilus]MDR7272643.1 hypothetical protein [Roseateles saccharophilus]
MRNRTALLVNMATGIFFGIVVFAMAYSRPQKRCEAADGKWSLASESCITRSCFLSGSCGTWAYPAERCSRLKAGDARSEVYFQLGDPETVSADEATWHAAKTSSDLIVARFLGDRLLSLSCPAGS